MGCGMGGLGGRDKPFILIVCSACEHTMVPTYTDRGATRYRYYVCQTAMKRGWAKCPMPSVPAQEIEDFVIQRIASIGRDPNLAAEVAERRRAEIRGTKDRLEEDRALLNRTIREQARSIAEAAEQPDAATMLADLQDRIQKGERRLVEIRSELAALGKETSPQEVASALKDFSALIGALAPFERAELASLLVERVVFNKAKGSLAISFRSTGFESLLSKHSWASPSKPRSKSPPLPKVKSVSHPLNPLPHLHPLRRV